MCEKFLLDERGCLENVKNVAKIVTDAFGLKKIIPKTLFREQPQGGELTLIGKNPDGLFLYERKK